MVSEPYLSSPSTWEVQPSAQAASPACPAPAPLPLSSALIWLAGELALPCFLVPQVTGVTPEPASPLPLPPPGEKTEEKVPFCALTNQTRRHPEARAAWGQAWELGDFHWKQLWGATGSQAAPSTGRRPALPAQPSGALPQRLADPRREGSGQTDRTARRTRGQGQGQGQAGAHQLERRWSRTGRAGAAAKQR